MNRTIRTSLLVLGITALAVPALYARSQSTNFGVHGNSLQPASLFDGSQPPVPPSKPLALDGSQPPVPPTKPLALDGSQPPVPPTKPLMFDGSQPPVPPTKPLRTLATRP
jgi:hypothetical protein